MTVTELIERLQTFPPDAHVWLTFCCEAESGPAPAYRVFLDEDGDVVVST